jgi:hypothetical protein
MHLSCYAQILVSNFNTADLVELCRKVPDPMQVDCAGYILGAYDKLAIAGLICPPEKSQWRYIPSGCRSIEILKGAPRILASSSGISIERRLQRGFPVHQQYDR